VAAAQGLEMPLRAYVTDIVVRWGLVDATAIFALALWSAFKPRAASNASALIVAAGVAAILSLSVRVFSHAAMNVLVHALAAGVSLLSARAVSARLAARSRTTRVVLALMASAVGYAAGRGIATLFL